MATLLLTLLSLFTSQATAAEEFSSYSVEGAGLSFSQFQVSAIGSGMGSQEFAQIGILASFRVSPWVGINAGVMASRVRISSTRLSTSAAGDVLVNIPVTFALFQPLSGASALELDLGPTFLTDVRPFSGGGAIAMGLFGIGYRLWPAEGGMHFNAGFDFMTDFSGLNFPGAHMALGYAF